MVKRIWLEAYESHFSYTVALTQWVAGFQDKPLPTTKPGQLNGCGVRWYDPDQWATITPREPCSVIACTARYMLQMEASGQPARLKHAVTLWCDAAIQCSDGQKLHNKTFIRNKRQTQEPRFVIITVCSRSLINTREEGGNVTWHAEAGIPSLSGIPLSHVC